MNYGSACEGPAEGLRMGGLEYAGEPGIGVAETPPGPCRSIEITDEIRAADTAAREARERNVSSAWAIKSSLSVENLRSARKAKRPIFRGAAQKSCSSCVAKISAHNKSGLCSACRRASRVSLMSKRGCSLCPAVLGSANKSGVCRACQKVAAAQSKAAWGERIQERRQATRAAQDKAESSAAQAREAVREQRRAADPLHCVDGCGRSLSSASGDGTCFSCRGGQKRKAQLLAGRPECANGCGRLLRRGLRQRADGLCGTCGANAKRAATPNRYRMRAEKAGCSCSECGVLIGPHATRGMCNRHAKLARSKKTILRAGSLDEWRSDMAWQSLSAEDKWTLLGGGKRIGGTALAAP